MPARRAVVRWAWRLFRREWRQQLLVLALIVVAVAATIVGRGGGHQHAAPGQRRVRHRPATWPRCRGPAPQVATQIAALQHRFGRVDVIENQTVAMPGSISTYRPARPGPARPVRAPMLSLVSGHYPARPGPGGRDRRAWRRLRPQARWRAGTRAARRRPVVGIVREPAEPAGRVRPRGAGPGHARRPRSPCCSTRPGCSPHSIGPNVQTVSACAAQQNAINPETIAIAAVTVGMLLIAPGGGGRLHRAGPAAAALARDARRRWAPPTRTSVWSCGPTAWWSALVGAVIGFVLGLAAWLAYRPLVEASAHHVIGVFSLPWLVIGWRMVLAVVAAYFAASRPARAITRIPVVTALSGRPAPPKQVRRSAMPRPRAARGRRSSCSPAGRAAASGGQGNGRSSWSSASSP